MGRYTEYPAEVVTRTAAQWAALNPRLNEGDICVESDTGRQKIGTGAYWASTSYQPLVVSPTITRIVQITQAAYDALATKDAATLYVITPS